MSSMNEQTTEDRSEGEEDSDEEPVVHRKKKSQRNVLQDSDYEDDSNTKEADSDRIDKEEKNCGASYVLGEIATQSSSKTNIFKSGDYDSDKENINPQMFGNERPVSRTQLRIPSESESDTELPEADAQSNAEEVTTRQEIQTKYVDLFDAEESDDEKKEDDGENSEGDTADIATVNKGSRIIKPDKLLSELFDAEESENESRASSDDEGQGQTESHDVCSDEEPQEMSESLRRRLAKGAAKKPGKTPSKSDSSKKTPRVNKDELQQLHSETQRMVREKVVHMPYHQPKKLDLDAVLARTKQKQEALQTLKGPRQVGWKKAQALTTLINYKDIDLKNKADANVLSDKKIEINLQDQDSNDGPHTSDLMQRIIAKQTNREESSKETSDPKSSVECEERMDLDTVLLPDTNKADTEETKDSLHISVSSSKQDNVKDTVYDSANQSTDSVIELVALTDVGITSITPIQSIVDNKSHDELKKPELDSGYLTTPALSVSEDSSCSQKPGDHPSESEQSSAPVDTENVESHTNHTEQSLVNLCETKDTMETAEIGNGLSNTKVPSGNIGEVKSDFSVADINSASSGIPTAQSSRLEAKLKRIAPKLKELGLNQVAPRLSGGPDAVIDLDDDDNDKTKKVDPGVMNLIQRFMKHSAKRPKKKSKDVDISTVIKVTGEDDKVELKLETISYHVESDEDSQQEAIPGAKLLKLKSRLREKMAKDREEARKQRADTEQYENEEGFEEEEEEEELTDESEEEDEEGEEVDEEEEEYDEEEYGADEQPEEENPFVDKEADEEDDEDGEFEEDALHLELDTKDEQEEKEKRVTARKEFLKAALCKSKSMPLFDDDDDQDTGEKREEHETQEDSNTSCDKEGSQPGVSSQRPFKGVSQSSPTRNAGQGDAKESGADTSFELMSSMLPAGQQSTCLAPGSPSSRSSASLQHKKSAPFLPIESTQDLFMFNATPTQKKQKSSTAVDNPSFQLEESDSLMLDDDGFLKVGSTKKSYGSQSSMSQQLGFGDSQGMISAVGLCSGKFASGKENKGFGADLLGTQKEDNMDDLMALCSGKFASSLSQKNPLTGGSMGFDVDNEGMSQIIGLCSGKFAKTQTGATQNQSSQPMHNMKNTQVRKFLNDKKQLQTVDEESSDSLLGGNYSDEDAPEADDFIVDDDEVENTEDNAENEDHLGFSDDEQDNVDGSENEEEEEEEEPQKFTGFFEQGKKRKLRQDFVEDEAELSGSEADSDENDDLDEQADVMEEEEGDFDVNMTEEALRNQVNRVHMKTVQDEEDRELRLMKEYYLADGDLHSDGGGRARRFRWANLDHDMEAGGMEASDEDEAAEDPMEEKWRLERFERERFLQEQKQQSEETSKPQSDEDENSLVIGSKVFKQKKLLSSVAGREKDVLKSSTAVNAKQPPKVGEITAPQNLFRTSSLKSGSFLKRSKDTLAKIANMSKPVVSNISGPRNSRSLLFSTMTEEKKAQQTESKEEFKKPQVKRSISTPSQPAAKKQKLDRSDTLPANSIFKLLQ